METKLFRFKSRGLFETIHIKDKIKNILESLFRWTTGYGEKYDYYSIMHYGSRAFVKDRNNKAGTTDIRNIGSEHWAIFTDPGSEHWAIFNVLATS